MKTQPAMLPSQTPAVKYPLQKEKIGEALKFLRTVALIKSQKQIAIDVFGVDDQTFSNWATGHTKLHLMAKKVFAHDFDIPLAWWEQKDVPIREVIGKGLGRDEKPQPLRGVAAAQRVLELRELLKQANEMASQIIDEQE